MINFNKVTKIYNSGPPALEDIDFNIAEGEFVSVVGPSGAGKSTLLKMLTREESPSAGLVMVEKVNLADLPDEEIPLLRRKIGTIFQDFKLLAKKTAFENVAFALEVSGASDEEIQEDVPRVLKIVGLEDKAGHYPNELSGGEKQRLAIARALINRPKILLADEPTGNLDLLNTHDVIQLLLTINKFSTTVILASHDREVVNTVGRRVITLEKGKIVNDQKKAGRYKI